MSVKTFCTVIGIGLGSIVDRFTGPVQGKSVSESKCRTHVNMNIKEGKKARANEVADRGDDTPYSDRNDGG